MIVRWRAAAGRAFGATPSARARPSAAGDAGVAAVSPAVPVAAPPAPAGRLRRMSHGRCLSAWRVAPGNGAACAGRAGCRRGGSVPGRFGL